jgi:hypothetical protein
VWANYGEPPLFSFEISGVRQQFKKSQKISETRYKFIIRPIRTKSLLKNNVFHRISRHRDITSYQKCEKNKISARNDHCQFERKVLTKSMFVGFSLLLSHEYFNNFTCCSHKSHFIRESKRNKTQKPKTSTDT